MAEAAEAGGEKVGAIARFKAYMKASRTNLLVGVVSILILAGIVLAVPTYGTYKYMTNPQTCGDLCKDHQPYTDAWAKSNHAKRGVDCIDCHDPPGKVDWALYNANNIYFVLKYYLAGTRADFKMLDTGERNYAWGEKNWQAHGKKIGSWVPTAQAANERCLRCHEDAFNMKGKTRSFDFSEPEYVNVGGGKTDLIEITKDDMEKIFVDEATNEKNAQAIPSFHSLHIDTPKISEAPWLKYALRENQKGDWETIGKVTCFDCHGFVMLNPDERFIEYRFEPDVESALTPPELGTGVGGTTPFILRTPNRGGTKQLLPNYVCLTCHDGKKAPAIYGEHGGKQPDEKWLGGEFQLK